MNIWKIKQEIKTRLGDQELEKKYLVILCNPRSGSTWLFDSLRAHPAIFFPKTNNFHNHFRLIGRRYPMDFANQSDGDDEYEVLPGKFEKLPSFQIESKAHHSNFSEKIAIEKIHPEFFKFNTNRFISKINKLEKQGHQFTFVVQLRHPSGTLNSIQKYWERNPNWLRTINKKNLIHHYKKTYESLLFFKVNYGGLIITYRDFIAAPSETLEKIYDILWSSNQYPDPVNKKIDIENSLFSTNRERRKTTGTSFLGIKAGSDIIDIDDLELVTPETKHTYQDCVELYNQLIKK